MLQVNYRESISKMADVRYIHKKQSGGSGQFADVAIRFEPGEPGSGFVFKSDIKGGTVPKEYIPGVVKVRHLSPPIRTLCSRYQTGTHGPSCIGCHIIHPSATSTYFRKNGSLTLVSMFFRVTLNERVWEHMYLNIVTCFAGGRGDDVQWNLGWFPSGGCDSHST